MTLCFVHSPLSFEFEGKEVLVGFLGNVVSLAVQP